MNEQKQIKYNFYSNIGTLIVNVVIGVMYVPYLVEHLGLVAYGIVPLALVVNQYINTITGSLTSALTRFYSVSFHKGEIKDASRNLSTAIFIVFILGVVCVGLMGMITANIDTIFNIPQQFIQSAETLFQYTILSLVLSLFSSVLNVTLYAKNRLDILNLIKLLRLLLKFVFVVIMFSMLKNDIQYVGLANFISEVVILVLSILFFISSTSKRIKISYSLISQRIFFLIFGMTSWVIVHQIGDVGIYRIDILAVNNIFGLVDSGALGAISEFGTYTLMIVSLISALFGPLILMAYSKGDHEAVVELAKSRSYISGILAAILAGSIAGFSVSILKVWLGENYVQYNMWLSLKMISLPFFAAGGVLAFIYRSWNKVKIPALATLILGLANTGLIVLVTIIMKNKISVQNIIMICLFFAIMQSYYINIYFANKIYNGIAKGLLWSSVKFSLIFVIAFWAGKTVEQFYIPNSILGLFLVLGCASMLIFGFSYLFFLKPDHRKQLKDMVV